MPTDVIMPQMGESIFEGTITRWLKKTGDAVQKDEPLFEISTDKVDAEIPSPIAGTLGEIKVQEGATVSINTVVATINEDGAQSAAPANSGAVPTTEDTVTPGALASTLGRLSLHDDNPMAIAAAAPATMSARTLDVFRARAHPLRMKLKYFVASMCLSPASPNGYLFTLIS